jgi:hypothetical protein
MSANVADRLPCSHGDVERRRRFRLYEPFPAKVRGKDSDGERFKIDTVLDNICSRGLYLRLARKIEPDADIFVVICLTVANDPKVFAPRVAVQGKVLRAEPQTDGSYGVALEFRQPRFL